MSETINTQGVAEAEQAAVREIIEMLGGFSPDRLRGIAADARTHATALAEDAREAARLADDYTVLAIEADLELAARAAQDQPSQPANAE
jgi:hypothetical protein